MRRILAEIAEPFLHAGRLHAALIVLFVVVNALVLANAIIHDPNEGYDAGDHIQYIRTLAEHRRIPFCGDSAQCYIPPLPYMLPALVLSTGRATLFEAAKFAQLVNVLLSMLLTYYLLRICALINPRSIVLRLSALAIFGMLPVFYKTFALIRGEVYLPLLVVFIAYMLLSISLQGTVNWASIVLLGLAMGLAILARQWGFLILPAVFVFLLFTVLKGMLKFQTALATGAACLVLPLVVAGWYYAIMFQRYGSLTAWDRPASSLNLAALPPEFYFGLGSGKLFTDPVRPSFSNQFPAIFYSDTWGDYSGYFLVYLKKNVNGHYLSGKELERLILANQPIPDTLTTNRFTMGSYLGRVNLVSLLPSSILVAGLAYGLMLAWRALARRNSSIQESASLLFTLIVFASLAGYAWYLLRYQNNGQGGDLIKAAHMMQIFPFLGLLGGQALARLDKRSHRLWLGTMILLGAVFLHNLPAMISHYPVVP